jgi:hypothetical protein
MGCRRRAIAARKNCVCLSCDKAFFVKPCELKRADKRSVGLFCSLKCKAREMVHRHKPLYHKSGKREDLENRYFRSSWEANYARYLNWLISRGHIERWEYEVDTFEFPVKHGTMFYTPDFKVFEKGSVVYHEIKGWMDAKSITRMTRMAKYYPHIKVLMIDASQYRALAKTAGRFIENWE